MSAQMASALRWSGNVGVVGCVYQLAPWAEFLVSTDRDWWLAYPDAMEFKGRKFSGPNSLYGLEVFPGSKTDVNSGVLALDVAKSLGASEIHLYGFDMHGSHYFGEYKNGLANTPERRRIKHIKQYESWAENNRHINVTNKTRGSALSCFPFE